MRSGFFTRVFWRSCHCSKRNGLCCKKACVSSSPAPTFSPNPLSETFVALPTWWKAARWWQASPPLSWFDSRGHPPPPVTSLLSSSSQAPLLLSSSFLGASTSPSLIASSPPFAVSGTSKNSFWPQHTFYGSISSISLLNFAKREIWDLCWLTLIAWSFDRSCCCLIFFLIIFPYIFFSSQYYYCLLPAFHFVFFFCQWLFSLIPLSNSHRSGWTVLLKLKVIVWAT